MPIIQSLLSALGLQRKARTDSGPIPLSGYTSGSYYDWTSTRGVPSPFSDTTPWHLNPVVAAGIAWFSRNFPVPDLHVVQDGGDDDGAEIEGHWLTGLFDKPNELWSFFDFFAASVSSDLVDGNTFWLKRKSRGEGKVVDLWWLDPWQVKIVPDPTRSKAVLVYEYVSGDVHERYEPDEIIHIRSAVPDRGDPRRGLSPLAAAERSIRVTNEVARYDEAILKNGGSSPGVFTPADPTQPIPDADISSLQAWYRRNQTGPNAGGPIFAPFGLTWQQTGFSPEQLSLDKLPKRHVSFILGAIGLSPMVLGYEDESKTYANFGEAMRAAYDSLRSVQDRFAEAVNHDADLILEGERLAWDYIHVPYLQENRGEKIASLVAAVGGGILTVDEARAELHYEPMPEEEKPEPPPEVEPELEEEDQVADLAAVLAGRNGHSNGNGKPTKPAKAVTEADLRERADRLLATLEAKLGPRRRVQVQEGEDRDPFPLETAAAVANLKGLYRAGSLSRKSAILALKAVRRGACRDRRGRFAACGGGSATSQDVRPEGSAGGTREPRRGRPQVGPPSELKPEAKPPATHLEARRQRVEARLATIGPERDAARKELDRAKAIHDTYKGQPHTQEKQNARTAYFAARKRHGAIESEHEQLAAWKAGVKGNPALVPPGPIKERLVDYKEGDAHVARLQEKLAPIAARKQEYEKAKTETESLHNKLTELSDSSYVLASKKDKAGAKAKKEEADAVFEQLKEIRGRRDTLRRELSTAQDDTRRVVAETLAVDKPMKVELQSEAFKNVNGQPMNALSPSTKQNVDEASTWLSGITSEGQFGIPIKRRIGERFGQRAYHSRDHIAVADGEFPDVIVHELGHAIERDFNHGGDTVGKRSIEFLEHRVGSETPVRIDSLPGVRPGAYKPDEMGRKDKFDSVFDDSPSAAHYVGKSYGSDSSEILSMGVQKLYNDPHKFITKDPEYAKFVIGVLRGDLR